MAEIECKMIGYMLTIGNSSIEDEMSLFGFGLPVYRTLAWLSITSHEPFHCSCTIVIFIRD